MPNLENLRKQAKQILRWHRERYYPVASGIRGILPRFQGLSDAEVLAHTFKLSDAQEMVARQSGFENWQALKTGVTTMSEDKHLAGSRPVLIAAEPQLFVVDLKASFDFFIRKLGFAVAFAYGEPPFYGQVMRDGVRLNLRCVGASVIDRELTKREGLLSASMTLASGDQIKQLYLEFQTAGVEFHSPLKKEPWGARAFIVKDPDGNLLLFAGPVD